MQKVQPTRNRRIVRNLAIYAAGAWGTIEFIDFVTGKYGLGANLLDFAIFFAVIGSFVVTVISWFHGESGRQKIPGTEIVILGVLALTVIGGMFAIGNRNPFSEFEHADGFRLTVAFRDGPPGETSNCSFHMRVDENPSSIAEMKLLAEAPFHMSPSEFRLTIPGVRLFGEHVPVHMKSSSEDELNRIVMVLPSIPEDLESLLILGADHDFGRIESANFLLQTDRAFKIIDQDGSATIRIKGPFALNGNRNCESEISE